MPEKRTDSADLSALRINRSEIDSKDKQSNSKAKLFLGISFALVVILGIFLFSRTNLGSSRELDYAVVRTVYPSQQAVVLTASGYVVAQRQAAIASKGSGRIEYLAVEEGDRVRKGEIIARLEDSDVTAAYRQAEANVAVRRAALITAEADFYETGLNFKRQQDLLNGGLISKAEFDMAEARYKIADAGVVAAAAQVDLAKAALTSAQVEVDNTRIRAPFDGTVLTKNADIGELVAPFAASSNARGAVVTIADMSSLEVEADVSEANIQRVETGQACEITLDAFPQKRYAGFVHKIVPTADRAKATVLTKIRFARLDANVLPEMSAKVNFLSGAAPSDDEGMQPFTAIPKSAILKRDRTSVVFVLNEGMLTETPVTTGREMSVQIEVVAGLISGQRVVVNPTEDLKSGLKAGIN